MKKELYISISILLGGTLTACGNPALDKKQIKNSAPLSQQETGLIVTGIDESKIAELMSENPGAKLRIINSKHNIYEVFNIDAKEIKTIAPEARASQNDFFKAYGPQSHNEINFRDFQFLAGSNDVGQAQPGDCINGSDLPVPKLKVNGSKNSNSEAIIELGEAFEIDASDSLPSTTHPSKLRKAWAVSPPRGSNQTQQILFGDKLNYKPDGLGLYSVMVLVQDDRNYCAYEMSGIVVTANHPFELRSLESFESYLLDSTKNISQFKHLKTLNADNTWKISKGTSQLIAVIDSGVNYNHPALNSNIEINIKEIPGNNIDDDKNGFIDDYVGYDFANSDSFPYDDQGHGSHVSGLAASPLFGMAKGARVLPIKALSPMGGDIGSIVGAIYYAVDRGAVIVNMSFGNYGYPHPSLIDAVDYAESKGVILVAAAGNGHPVFRVPVDTDLLPNYPSALPNDNIISVAAFSLDMALAPYSNYGVNSVDLVTTGGSDPNDLMVSTFLENPAGIEFEGMSGTSMASPIVAGIAAQLLEIKPDLSPAELKHILMSSGELRLDLKNKIGSGRHLDGLAALKMATSLKTQLIY